MKHLKLYEDYKESLLGHPGFIQDPEEAIQWILHNFDISSSVKPYIKNRRGLWQIDWDVYIIYVNAEYLRDDIIEDEELKDEMFPDGKLPETPEEFYSWFRNFGDYDEIVEFVYNDGLHDDITLKDVEYFRVPFGETDYWNFVINCPKLKSFKGVPKGSNSVLRIYGFGDAVSIDINSSAFRHVIANSNSKDNPSLILEARGIDMNTENDLIPFMDISQEEKYKIFLDRLKLRSNSDIIKIVATLQEELPEHYENIFKNTEVKSWLSKLDMASKYDGVIKL